MKAFVEYLNEVAINHGYPDWNSILLQKGVSSPSILHLQEKAAKLYGQDIVYSIVDMSANLPKVRNTKIALINRKSHFIRILDLITEL